MLKHYLLIIYRNIIRSKDYFAINVVGLTTGLACTLLIYLWVRDELAMDKFHEKDERLFQVMEHQQYADHIMTTTSTPGILAENLRIDFPEVEFATTATWIQDYTLSVKDHNVKARGYHVGEDYFQLFSLNLLEGDAASVLKDKSGIVISRDLAVRLFGTDSNLVGKTVEFQHEKLFQVSGVFEGTPPNSSYQFDFVISFEIFKDENEWVNYWGNNGPSTFVTLIEGTSPQEFEKKIAGYIQQKNADTKNITLFLQKYSDRYLYGAYDNGKPAGGRIEYVWMFSVVAAFILVIACINFMNLSTARASRKAKEVGIKKSIGAQRRSLVIQFLSESMITTVISVLLSIGLVWLLLPQLNLVFDKRITLDLTNPQLLAAIAIVVVVTGLFAGSYPALYLSGFQPAAVLKGVAKGSIGEIWARKGLVVFQFLLSVVFIVSVLVVYKQIEFVQTKNLGYNKDQLIRFVMEGKLGELRETFLKEVRNIPGVVNASAIGHHLTGRNSNTIGLDWPGKNPEDRILFENVPVDYQLLETLGVELTEGRFFDENIPTDTGRIIFNEAAIRVMGLENPIGTHVNLWGEYDLEIVGVVKDFHFQSLHTNVNPLFFWLSPGNTWVFMVRLEAGREKETLEKLEALYKEFNPGFSFDFRFQDEQYARMYQSEQRVATLSGYFAGIAIIISCLGLFGLAAFTAERRLKEIGIRKALGSSSANIVLLLSGDFTKMVLVSIALGLPLSFYIVDYWLEQFAFRIELNVWYFVAAGGVAMLIAWLTVASQALRASSVNPVECLRNE